MLPNCKNKKLKALNVCENETYFIVQGGGEGKESDESLFHSQRCNPIYFLKHGRGSWIKIVHWTVWIIWDYLEIHTIQ